MELRPQQQFILTHHKAQTNTFHKDELHLTPIRSTVQLRPNLKYLDKIDEKMKVANKKTSDEDEGVKKTAETESKAKTVQVRVFWSQIFMLIW